MENERKKGRQVTSISLPARTYWDLREIALERARAGDHGGVSGIVNEAVAPVVKRHRKARGDESPPAA